MAMNTQQLTQMVETMNAQMIALNQMLEASQAEIIRVKQVAEQTREAVRMGQPGGQGGGGDRGGHHKQVRLIDHKSVYPDIFEDDRTKFRRWANRVTAFCNGMHPDIARS